MEYNLIRTDRKTIGLYVRRDGTLEVRAPYSTTVREIEGILAEKSQWIEKGLKLTQERLQSRQEFSLKIGDTLPYLGRSCLIAPSRDNRLSFDGNYFYAPEGLSSDSLILSFAELYKVLAKRELTERAMRLSRLVGRAPSSIKINGARTRWGSCSTRGAINFSWRLMAADEATVDYVVIHELVHLLHPNHSPAFWAEMERLVPNYRECKERLKALSTSASIITAQVP